MIDVVVIAHNSEKNIENLLLNLAQQSGLINTILIDNGCRKKESEILKFYSRKYKMPLFVCSHYNIRVAKTEGLNRCKNEYVFFLGGNDTIPNNFFANFLDCTQDIIISGNKNKDYTFEDLLKTTISPSIYGKLFKCKLLIHMGLSYNEENEIFYKCDSDITISEKKINGYKHKASEIYKKEFGKEYKIYQFYYEQLKYFKDVNYLRIVIPQLIKAGNDAYCKMITDKDKYKVEMNNIKSCYICLPENHCKGIDNRTFLKIKNGKFTENDINTQKYKATKKITELAQKALDEFKPTKPHNSKINTVKITNKKKKG